MRGVEGAQEGERQSHKRRKGGRGGDTLMASKISTALSTCSVLLQAARRELWLVVLSLTPADSSSPKVCTARSACPERSQATIRAVQVTASGKTP